MKACDHPSVGLCWNSNPTDLMGGTSVKPAFDLLQPWIRNCHINELWSDYPWREFFTLLRESGYNRYTLAEMGAIWSETARFEHMLRVEIAVARAQVRRGLVPADALALLPGRASALDRVAARRLVRDYRFFTLGVIARIHWQAAKLWVKRVPFFRKPQPPQLPTTR